MDYFAKKYLDKIFYSQKTHPSYVGSRESTWLEFKESFSFGNLDEYARTMAAFTNHSGGYIVFGVKNHPREIAGVDHDKFQSIDSAKLTEGLNDLFSSEIEWAMSVYSWQGKDFGLIYTHESQEKPIIARKTATGIKEADIYYRYNGRTENIKFPELSKIISKRLEQEKYAWMDVLKRTASIGPQNVALMDTLKGKIEGVGGTVLIDEDLLPKLKFIKKGEFDEEKGAITLKLVGELKSAPVTAFRERQVVVGTDIYKFRPQTVCKIVSEKIRRVFRLGSEHIKAWKNSKVRPNGKPRSLPFKNEYCEYKEADDNYRYSQAWVDLLISKYSNSSEYQKLKNISIN